MRFHPFAARGGAAAPVLVVGRHGFCLSHAVKRLLQGLDINPALHEVAGDAEFAGAVAAGRLVGGGGRSGHVNRGGGAGDEQRSRMGPGRDHGGGGPTARSRPRMNLRMEWRAKFGPLYYADDGTRDGADGQVQDETRDNRSLVDNNTAQNLSSEDIEAMKRDGATGDEIVEALIANSTTFGKKTVFSQEKYKLKKQKKYAPKVLLRRPTARSICETYFKKSPARIGFMRVDTLSLMLSMANVGPYSDVLVFDMVGGLVSGAVAERLGGTGYVCSTYLGKAPSSIDIIRMYNLSGDMTSRIVQAPLNDLQNSVNTPSVVNGSSQGEVTEPIVGSAEDTQLSLAEQGDTSVLDEKPQLSTEQPIDMEVSEAPLEEHPAQDDTSSLGSKGNDGRSIAFKSVHGKAPSPEKIKYWKEHGFSSLTVAAPGHEVGSLVADLLPLLSYSAPFAIYHQYLQPLATCMHSLQVSKMAIGLQISEPWLREYQVLPSRTHPHMQMNAFGGYILSGIRIHNTDAVIANK